jgi:predicted oxidoreductase (fatty acid repression mutant protein)
MPAAARLIILTGSGRNKLFDFIKHPLRDFEPLMS